jgi:CelD/BcsL family acetyltransferase involved in cellulose biosynthesis
MTDQKAHPVYTIVVVEGATQLVEHVAAWDELAENALEPNAFYESWALMPALRTYARGADLKIVLVYLSPDGTRKEPLLCGFVPLQRRRLHKGLPVAILEPWQHLYCFLSTPLLRKGHATQALDVLFDWLNDDPRGGALLRLNLVSGDGGFAKALTEVCGRRRRTSYVAQSYCRAVIEPRSDAVSYIREALAGRHFKEYRRQERVLAKHGHYERRVLKAGDDIADWAEMFLRLEAKGWKGEQGSALASSPADAEYFRQLVNGAAERGKLTMLGLFLNGEPLALKCNFASGAGSFAFKIAFDEAYAATSPGVLLELANIELLHDSASTHWMDSCAVAEHPMINRLWLERRLILDQYIATGRAPGDALVALLPLGRWLKRALRQRRNPPPTESNES